MNDSQRLLAELGRARRRAENAVPHSPDWDAATDAVEELEAALGITAPATSPDPEEQVEGAA